METYELVAQVRSRTGKGVARKLRARGDIPAVCYRKGIDSIPLSVNRTSIGRLIEKAARRNVLITLTIKNGDHEERKTVMLKEMQRGPLAELLHVDFLEVLMDQKIAVQVPVRLVGEAPEVARAGATIQLVRREIELECLPSRIPDYIDIDVSALGIGDSVQVEDITVGEGIRILTDPKEAVVTILAAEKEIEEKPPEEEEVVSEGQKEKAES